MSIRLTNILCIHVYTTPIHTSTHLYTYMHIFTHVHTCACAHTHTHSRSSSSNHSPPHPSLWHRVGRAYLEEHYGRCFRSKVPHFSSPAYMHSAALPLRNGWVSAVSFPMHLLTIPETPSLKQTSMPQAAHCYGPPRMQNLSIKVHDSFSNSSPA